MDKQIIVGLGGHPARYRLDPDAFARLTGFLDRAAIRLHDDADRAEVLDDLERSIGDRLAVLVGSSDRLITVGDMVGILDAIGAVETGHEPRIDGVAPRPPARRLQRIREGQEIAGVCTGLAAYSEIDVDWIRTVFILGTLVTAGILGIVYIALALILPIASTHELGR